MEEEEEDRERVRPQRQMWPEPRAEEMTPGQELVDEALNCYPVLNHQDL